MEDAKFEVKGGSDVPADVIPGGSFTEPNVNKAGVHELRDMARGAKAQGYDIPLTGKEIVMADRATLVEVLKRAIAKGKGGEPTPGGDKDGADDGLDVLDEPKGGKPDGKDEGADEPKGGGIFDIAALVRLVRKALMPDVKRLIDALPKGGGVSKIEITVEGLDGKKEIPGPVHPMFEKFIKTIVNCGVFLPGPAGSGKSYVSEIAAEMLGVKHYYLQCVNTTTKSDLLGYNDAAGRYQEPYGFKSAVKHGGVFCVDEADAANPNILLCINDVANKIINNKTSRFVHFPDGEAVQIHKDFHLVMTANTWGLGADAQYVGRNALDASTRSRFAYIPWDFADDLERCLIPDEKVLEAIWLIRKAVRSIPGEKLLVSTRHGMIACKLLKLGCWNLEEALDATVWAGASADVKNRVTSKAKEYKAEIKAKVTGAKVGA